MNITYRAPSAVQPEKLQGRPLLRTCEGGRVAIDAPLLSLWKRAGGRALSDILAETSADRAAQEMTRAGLACLAEAGLLTRDSPKRQPSFQPVQGSTVTVVIVNFNSREWLEGCLASLRIQTFSPLEIIVVDNASSDDSAQQLVAHDASIKFIRLDKQRSFAGAVNRGIAEATGAFYLLLNPDVRLEPDAVERMVQVAQSDPKAAAVAAKLKFTWAPAFLNGLGNQVNPFAWASDNALGHLDLGQFDQWTEIPSACFAAALIPRAAWQVVGPLDEAFTMYYEDTEWCYRARLLGYKVLAAPQAVALHAFSGRVPSGQGQVLLVTKLRHVALGRLRFAAKLWSRARAVRFLGSYAFADLVNAVLSLLLLRWRRTTSYLGAWRQFLGEWKHLRQEQHALERRRVGSEKDLWNLQRSMPPLLIWRGLPELTWDIVGSHYLPLIRSGETRLMPESESARVRPRLLIVSNDVVDEHMAGPGMRYLEMARALSGYLDVTLATPKATTLEVANVDLATYTEADPGKLKALVEKNDVVLISGSAAARFPFLQDSSVRVVVDLYDPYVLENLYYYTREPMRLQEDFNRQAVDYTNRLARMGDYFICGSERQRDFWIGVLSANGRVNPHTFHEDSSLRSLIDVVGIGMPQREPESRPLLRGLHPGLPPECRIVLWGGGVWDWLDPLTLLQAWPAVSARHADARLVFLGTRHPNPTVPPHAIAERLLEQATRMGVKDHSVFFIEWLPYHERERLLGEAHVGVVLHPLHIETRFSIRTRVLDYLWARLPVLTSEGDVMSEWISRHGGGCTVPPQDVSAVERALSELLEQPKDRWERAFVQAREEFGWPRVVEPLERYCLTGHTAPDRGTRPATATAPNKIQWGRDIQHALYILRIQGPRMLIHRLWRYGQWWLASR